MENTKKPEVGDKSRGILVFFGPCLGSIRGALMGFGGMPSFLLDFFFGCPFYFIPTIPSETSLYHRCLVVDDVVREGAPLR
jgi:hypothetical protein